MNYQRAKCYTISSSNINTIDIIQFLVIFAKNCLFYPKILKRPTTAGVLPDSSSVAPLYHNIDKGKLLIC